MKIESMMVILQKNLGLQPKGIRFYGHRKNFGPKNQKSAKLLARENRDNRKFGANFQGAIKSGPWGLET